MRYIPVDNGIQQHGRHGGSGEWQGMAVYGCCCVYIGIMIAWRQAARYTNATRGVYLCTICKHSIQPPSPELRNARVRVSRVRVCVCVILLYYYNIIILLYYYIYIYPIYPIYLIYIIYPTMVIYHYNIII